MSRRVSSTAAEGLAFARAGALVPDTDRAGLMSIIATAADVTLIVDAEGQVIDATHAGRNAALAEVANWAGTSLYDHITEESHDKLRRGLDDPAGSGEREINHVLRGERGIAVRYSFASLGPDAPIMLTGRDLSQIEQMQQQLVRSQIALERDYERSRQYETFYRVLLANMHDAFVIAEVENGRIIDMSAAAGHMLGDTQGRKIGGAFVAEFDEESRERLLVSMNKVATKGHSGIVRARASKGQRVVNIETTLFRAAGETYLLCRLQPQSSRKDMPADLSPSLGALYNHAPEAIVFLDSTGAVHRANESFLSMVEAALHDEVVGRPFADFAGRGAVDANVVLENVRESGRISLYAATLRSIHGRATAVEMSAALLSEDGEERFGLVIRDVSRGEGIRQTEGPVSSEAVEQVMELVGRAPLRDLVRSTTDVVEKMCIETALRLTNNNRAAAAEMLGLSRQSLYVKLRKFGLLEDNSAS